MQRKLLFVVIFASLGVSLGLLGGNLISTFAVESPYTEVSVDESLFDFDREDSTESSEESSSEESSSEESSSSSSSSKGGHGHHGHGSSSSSSEESSSSSSSSSSESDGTSIDVSLLSYNDIDYCLVSADLEYLSDLRTGLAVDSSGSAGVNIKSSFSELIANATGDVILAIDGDFPFWSNSRQGYVIRNGVGLRSTARSDGGDDLAIFKDGSFLVYDEADYSYDEIMAMNEGCYQNWSFGPSLIKEGAIAVGVNEEISGKSMSANQRTAMGIKEDGTFLFICSSLDGSRQSGEGLSLYEVASILLDNGCVAAYNFDGGGSSALYYNIDGQGTYFMNPSRELGDIVYVVA